MKKKMMASTAISLVFAALFLFSSVHSFYLPGVAPRDFQIGDPLPVKVNKLSSTKTQLPYDYYFLNYCKPTKIVNNAENLGEVLRGDRIENSVYTFQMRKEQSCTVVRHQKLDAESAKSFKEKIDDDTNYHMDLIAGLANMRARNYSIPEVDKLKAKFIAGRIIPAIATSTAMATGLVCLELYKVLDGGHKVEDYRNTFANLALPLFSMAEPVPPKVIKHQDMSWTVWDRWIVKDNPTLRELLEWLKAKGLNAYSISCGSCLLYNSMFPKHKERMDRKIVDLAREVAKVEIPSYRRHLDVVVACEDDEDNDIDIPQISIYFR